MIQVYEHDTLKLGMQGFTAVQLEALQRFHAAEGELFYSLLHKGVKFKSYVGVLQVGGVYIEILPKADRSTDATVWRGRLIGMLQAVGELPLHAPTSSQLALRPNAVLSLYFSYLVEELEYLLHRGLIKKYHAVEGNRTALKGRLLFAQQLRHNLVHQERFYVQHTTYDTQHLLHAVLYKALCLLKQLNRDGALSARIGLLLLDFPPQANVAVFEATFLRLDNDRKSEPYRKALQIARLLLLNYHPDLSKGQQDVLALLFDMNQLWERFVYASLRRHLPAGYAVSAQQSRHFWRGQQGGLLHLRPDLLVKQQDGRSWVLDTKWKQLQQHTPSMGDLRQIFAYLKYYGASQGALLYPAETSAHLPGQYIGQGASCSVLLLASSASVVKWQREITEQVLGWMEGED